MRNFECILCTSQPKQLRERSASLRNIKPAPPCADEPGFDRVCNSTAKFRQFVSETYDSDSLYVVFSSEDCEPFQSYFLEACKALLEAEQPTTLTLSIWDISEQEQVDATSRSSKTIACHQVQFLSEVKRLLNRKDFPMRPDFSCRLFKVHALQQDQQRELVFLQTTDFDKLEVKDQIRSALLGQARQTKNKLVSWLTNFLSRPNYALYIVALAGNLKKGAKAVCQFCADLSDQVLASRKHRSSNKKPLAEVKQNTDWNSTQKQTGGSRSKQVMSLSQKASENVSRAHLQAYGEEGLQDPTDKIALKRKEGLNRLLMQLESDNRYLKIKLATQKSEFEQQTNEYIQKRNRKIGKLKLQINQLQDRLKTQLDNNRELEAKLKQCDGSAEDRRHYEKIIQSLQREREELRSELARTRKQADEQAQQARQQFAIYEGEMESMRSKLDCLDAANNKQLEELERHMEDYASENEQLRMQCDKFESEAKASQQNESKYLEEISRLEYRFLKERGKYVAEKNNTQKLARELEVMDQKLRNIIDMKSQEIVHMTEDSACCD